ncbi:unnamed protein product [Nippostrongylus brasiliensis]|uniref:Reverse transcriptase domain-containing protein n=1 Tax=Nippostrongylus brasiliensis TaxID=27835 RepID=A0A0N4XF49_NIPBR|nr:unnamed protein product [Nippostrongylus brasiliensis]
MLPTLRDSDGHVLHTDEEKAEALGKYFSSVFTADDVTSSSNLRHPNSPSETVACNDIYFHPTEISSLLQQLKPSLSIPIDGIPQIVYKKCHYSLSKPLSYLFNLSFYYGEVPQLWKQAIVTPIPKCSNASQVSDFRPISITPTPVKVMEKIIGGKLLSWMNRSHFIPKEQHGFLPGASTSTNLIDAYYDWCSALSVQKSVDIVYFDLSKAFDKVSHPMLLNKMQRLGVGHNVLSWVKSYLSERYMVVRVKKSFSSTHCCTSGVPQGGVLSPLLFLIYTLELSALLKSSPDIGVQIYADDVKIYGVYNSRNSESVRTALQTSITKMNEWALEQKIPLNLKKCAVMHLGTIDASDYEVAGLKLNRCDSSRDLGIWFSSTLSFSSQLEQLTKKAYQVLFQIFRTVTVKDSGVMIRLYKSYVLPHLEYGSIVWNPHLKREIHKVEKVQKLFTRLLWLRVTDSVRQNLPSYSERLRLFSLLSLQHRRIIADLVFCFRILRGEVRLQPSKYWVFRPVSPRLGRFGLEVSRSLCLSRSQMANMVFCRCARWFRLLPVEVLEADNSKAFRARLKRLDIHQLLGVPSE